MKLQCNLYGHVRRRVYTLPVSDPYLKFLLYPGHSLLDNSLLHAVSYIPPSSTISTSVYVPQKVSVIYPWLNFPHLISLCLKFDRWTLLVFGLRFQELYWLHTLLPHLSYLELVPLPGITAPVPSASFWFGREQKVHKYAAGAGVLLSFWKLLIQVSLPPLI